MLESNTTGGACAFRSTNERLALLVELEPRAHIGREQGLPDRFGDLDAGLYDSDGGLELSQGRVPGGERVEGLRILSATQLPRTLSHRHSLPRTTQ